MLEKNKFVYALLCIIKEDIIKNKEPIYNPLALIGLDKASRYNFFFRIFDKSFNSQYKSFIVYKTIDSIDLANISKNKLIILENIHEIEKNKKMQDKLHKLLNLCLKLKVQVVLCSDKNIEKLNIDEILKSKMLSGLTGWLNEE